MNYSDISNIGLLALAISANTRRSPTYQLNPLILNTTRRHYPECLTIEYRDFYNSGYRLGSAYYWDGIGARP